MFQRSDLRTPLPMKTQGPTRVNPPVLWKTPKYLIFIILITIGQPCFAQKKNVSWKIYDQDLNLLTKVSTREISIFEDFVWYKWKGKYGVRDLNNNILIPPKYDAIRHHAAGLTSVGIRNCFGMVRGGKEILSLNYGESFTVDSSGYFETYNACSENLHAYFIANKSLYDKAGNLISSGCETDTRRMLNELTGRRKKEGYNYKEVSNGFVLKAMPSDKYLKKGIYNRTDSFLFSCIKCNISDNLDGLFLIRQRDEKNINYECYMIDTLGRIKIKADYSSLSYRQKQKLFIFERGPQKGIVFLNGKEKVLTSTKQDQIEVISQNRFLITHSDSSRVRTFEIVDSSANTIVSRTLDYLGIRSERCLIRRSATGYFFIDENGRAVSNHYDSVFTIPEFNYTKMVLGDNRPRYGIGGCVHATGGYFERDGFALHRKSSSIEYYGVARNGKIGLFNTVTYTDIDPAFDLVASAQGFFPAKKGRRWFVINRQGMITAFKNSKYINFSDKYILVGD